MTDKNTIKSVFKNIFMESNNVRSVNTSNKPALLFQPINLRDYYSRWITIFSSFRFRRSDT